RQIHGGSVDQGGKRDQPPGAEDSLDLGQRLLGIGDVKENRLGEHHVEAVVCEGKVEDVPLPKYDVPHAQVASAPAGPVELLRAEVDPDGLPVRCPLGEADGDRTRTAATVEDPTGRVDVVTEESTRALRCPKSHVR